MPEGDFLHMATFMLLCPESLDMIALPFSLLIINSISRLAIFSAQVKICSHNKPFLANIVYPEAIQEIHNLSHAQGGLA